MGNYSVIIGGNDHTISSDYSIALGEATNIQHKGTFAWSDYNEYEYRQIQDTPKLISTKDNTFLVRSLNGMGINTPTAPDGVNVNVNGSTYLGGTSKLISSGTIETSCNASIMGTFETLNGCYYFCDGKYWQIVNMPFEGDDVAKNCAHNNVASKTCYLDGFNLRAGDTMEAYNTLKVNASSCASAKTTVTCKVDGTLDKPAYKYANCFTGS